ncbi:MAG TPA: HRDC domain-containing protein, partial [Verrucomicrobiae bacterium]|nr:HRDC domain-containing protein [Verrucomicrobiae bacterium]
RAEWKIIGRELMRLGFVEQLSEKFNVLALTDSGLDVLKERRPVQLTKPVSAPDSVTRGSGEIACDQGLFQELVELRKQLADRRGVPPHIILSDISLRLMARNYPITIDELLEIEGMAERKTAEFGSDFISIIQSYVCSNPRQMFAELPASPKNFTRERRSRRAKAALSEGPYDIRLFERLKALRRKIAQDQGLAAFMVFHDATLREMARQRPLTLHQLAEIPRVGSRKAASLGPKFLTEIKTHLSESP